MLYKILNLLEIALLMMLSAIVIIIENSVNNFIGIIRVVISFIDGFMEGAIDAVSVNRYHYVDANSSQFVQWVLSHYYVYVYICSFSFFVLPFRDFLLWFFLPFSLLIFGFSTQFSLLSFR
jgi:hypothetical protein